MKQPTGINLEEVGIRLRKVRKTLKYSLEDMYQMTGFSKSLICEAENGQKKPSSTYLFHLLDKFNVNINFIFKGKGTMFLPETEMKLEMGKDKDKVKDMLFHMEHVEFIRYSILSHFMKFKAENKKVINEILEEQGTKRKENS